MKKSFCLMFVFIITFLTSACGNSTENDENTLSFPINDYAKTEFNSKIYDMEKFSLSLNLPDGWSAKKREVEGEEFVMLSVFSKYDILNKDKELVGVAGFNVYEPYEGAEEEPAAIYNQIALGNDYQFDVRDSYNVVNETETGKNQTELRKTEPNQISLVWFLVSALEKPNRTEKPNLCKTTSFFCLYFRIKYLI